MGKILTSANIAVALNSRKNNATDVIAKRLRANPTSVLVHVCWKGGAKVWANRNSEKFQNKAERALEY